jgi:hypothetical protein
MHGNESLHETCPTRTERAVGQYLRRWRLPVSDRRRPHSEPGRMPRECRQLPHGLGPGIRAYLRSVADMPRPKAPPHSAADERCGPGPAATSPRVPANGGILAREPPNPQKPGTLVASPASHGAATRQ